MAFLDFLKAKNVAGLDIGSFSLKMVELSPKKKGDVITYELVALGYEPVPYQSIVEGTIMDSTAVVDAVNHVFYESKTKTKNVSFGVSGSSVIVKRIEVQKLAPAEMHEHILWEIRPHIPFNPDEVNLDYQIIESADIPPDKVGVILTAVKKEKLNEYSNIFSMSDRTAAIVDLDSFAILNSVMVNYEMYKERSIAIINIGASITNVVIARAGVPVFVRDIAFGGNHFTDLIQKELNLKYEKAESVKKGRQVDGVSQAAVKPVLDLILDELKSEVKKTFEFYRSNSSDGGIDNILLCGGTANLNQIVDIFYQEFDIPVEIVNPFNNIEINEKKFDLEFIKEMAPIFNVAMGLALRAVGD
jgi:type IV pilus assembly protein PilM